MKHGLGAVVFTGGGLFLLVKSLLGFAEEPYNENLLFGLLILSVVLILIGSYCITKSWENHIFSREYDFKSSSLYYWEKTEKKEVDTSGEQFVYWNLYDKHKK